MNIDIVNSIQQEIGFENWTEQNSLGPALGSLVNREYWAKWASAHLAPPFIIAHPESQTVAVGSAVVFQVSGGAGTSCSAYIIESPPVTLPIPEKDGFTFAG